MFQVLSSSWSVLATCGTLQAAKQAAFKYLMGRSKKTWVFVDRAGLLIGEATMRDGRPQYIALS